MALLTWWTWVWVNSGSWWWTERPGVLRFMGLQRVGHDWVTELNWYTTNGTYYTNTGIHTLTMGKAKDFILGGSKITADGDCSHEIKRHLLLGKTLMTNLDSILKSRNITLPTKVRLTKAMVPSSWVWMWAAAAKSLQSCPTLCDPIDGSPPGSSIPGILQARTLEWVAISFSNACMHAKSLQSCPTLCNLMDSSPPGSSVHGIL